MPPRRASTAHFMLKEIHEQPRAIADTLQERVANGRLLEAAFGPAATEVFERTRATCTSSPAARATTPASSRATSSSRSASIPCAVEIASEYRYRNPRGAARTRCSSPSRSRARPPTRWRRCAWRSRPATSRRSRSATCPESSLVRESELVHADARGPGDRRRLDQGVHHAAGRARHAGRSRSPSTTAPTPSASAASCTRLIELPALIEKTLELDPVIHQLAERFADKHHALFLGRGALYPIAMEGALKLKEISYIHAEAYSGRRAQARPAGAGRCRHAGGRRGAQQRPAREAEVQPAGSARARRRAVSCSPIRSRASSRATASP